MNFCTVVVKRVSPSCSPRMPSGKKKCTVARQLHLAVAPVEEETESPAPAIYHPHNRSRRHVTKIEEPSLALRIRKPVTCNAAKSLGTSSETAVSPSIGVQDRELHNHRSNGQSNQTHDLMKSPITSYERNQSLDDQAISVDKNEDHPMPGIHVIRYQIRNPHQPRIRLVEDKDPNPVTVSGPKHRMTSLKPQLSDSQSDQRRIFRIPRMEQKPFTPSHHLDFSRDENEGDSTSISRRETPVSSPNVQFNEAQSDDTGMRRITYEDMAAPFPRQRAKENGKTNFIDYVFQSGPDEMEYAEAWQAFRAQGKSDNVVRRLWRIEREPAVRDMASASQTEVAGHISFSANNEQGDLTAKWVKQPSVIKPNNMVDTTVGGEDEDDESKLADDFGAYSFPEQIETADPQQRYNMQRLAIANGIFHSADQDMLLKTVQRLLSVTKDPSPPLPSLEEKDKEKEKEGEKG